MVPLVLAHFGVISGEFGWAMRILAKMALGVAKRAW